MAASLEFWRIERVKRETGLGTSTIYEAMAAGTFPQNFPISKQARAWASYEVEAWKRAKQLGKCWVEGPRPEELIA